MKKKVLYRVSVKYTSGKYKDKYVVQCCDATYKEACELYNIWTADGFDVLIIRRNIRKPDLLHPSKYKPKKKKVITNV